MPVNPIDAASYAVRRVQDNYFCIGVLSLIGYALRQDLPPARLIDAGTYRAR